MKRRASERGISTEDLASKQRIVRRKHRTPSPDLDKVTTKSHREVRTSSGITTSSGSGGLYTSKYANKYEQRSHKTDSQIREERLGTKYDSYNPTGSYRNQQQDPRTERRGGTGGHHHSPRMTQNFMGVLGEKFDYSLRVGNLDFKMADGDLKKTLFNMYKKYGYINIKLLGTGKERHAFINFSREEDARTALSETQSYDVHGHRIEVNWSRSTLPRLTGGHNESSRGSVKRRLLGPINTGSGRGTSRSRSSSPVRRGVSYKEDFRRSPRERDHGRSTRDISYRTTNTTSSTSAVSVSPPPLSHSHERGGGGSHMTSGESGRHTPTKNMPTIVDSNATRTLFVGNLEFDITERELRDLFGVYGRIESVDIKSHRQSDSAYAFVKFFTINDAIAAKNDIQGRQYGSYRLKIGFGKGNPSIKVWIGNISCYADLTEIRQELDRFGLIRKVEYIKGDNHAMVHFDSMDAAQTAVNSLQDYRFRSTNRPLKIDILSKSLTSRGSEFDDFEIEVISPSSTHLESRWTTGGGGKSSQSRDDSELPSRSENYRRRITHEEGSRNRDDGRDGHYHQDVISRNGRNTFSRIVSESSSRSEDRSNRSGNLRNSSGYERFDRGSGDHNEGANYRKRARSPSMNQEDHFNSSTGHFGRRHSSGDERGGASFNGGSEYRNKKPRNSFDAYKYHKLYGSRADDKSKYGSSHYDKDKYPDESRDRDLRDGRGRVRDRRDRDYPSTKDNSRRDVGDRRDSRSNKEEKKDSTDDKKNSSEAPPPPPPRPVLLSNDTADTALKLNNSTDVHTGNGVASDSNLSASNAETISDLAKRFPIVWKGTLVLKNTGFPTRMHLIGGDPAVVELLIRSKDGKDEMSSLRITQRLRLEPPRLEEVNKRMASAGPSGHCILLALAGPTPSQSSGDDSRSDSGVADSSTQLRPLKSLVSYLKQKEAAGIVALSGPERGSSVALNETGERDNVIGVLHAFPPCEFSQSQLLKIAPHLGEDTSKEDHIVVLLVKGTV